jgi:hypothetical protein
MELLDHPCADLFRITESFQIREEVRALQTRLCSSFRSLAIFSNGAAAMRSVPGRDFFIAGKFSQEQQCVNSTIPAPSERTQSEPPPPPFHDLTLEQRLEASLLEMLVARQGFAAINRAKDSGDIETLREIAEDPHGFILRQGWASLDFSEEAELTQLRRLYETLQLEIITVIESLSRLRESPEYELCQISEHKPGVLDELVTERGKLLAQESSDLEKQASHLATEIAELTGEQSSRIG